MAATGRVGKLTDFGWDPSQPIDDATNTMQLRERLLWMHQHLTSTSIDQHEEALFREMDAALSRKAAHELGLVGEHRVFVLLWRRDDSSGCLTCGRSVNEGGAWKTTVYVLMTPKGGVSDPQRPHDFGVCEQCVHELFPRALDPFNLLPRAQEPTLEELMR